MQVLSGADRIYIYWSRPDVSFTHKSRSGGQNDDFSSDIVYTVMKKYIINESVHEISNNVVCATCKVSDQPAHTGRLIRAFDSRLSIL